MCQTLLNSPNPCHRATSILGTRQMITYILCYVKIVIAATEKKEKTRRIGIGNEEGGIRVLKL